MFYCILYIGHSQWYSFPKNKTYVGITYHIWKGEGGGVPKAPKTHNLTWYQKFTFRHPLDWIGLLCHYLSGTACLPTISSKDVFGVVSWASLGAFERDQPLPEGPIEQAESDDCMEIWIARRGEGRTASPVAAGASSLGPSTFSAECTHLCHTQGMSFGFGQGSNSSETSKVSTQTHEAMMRRW